MNPFNVKFTLFSTPGTLMMSVFDSHNHLVSQIDCTDTKAFELFEIIHNRESDVELMLDHTANIHQFSLHQQNYLKLMAS